jgi:hypothetical protein
MFSLVEEACMQRVDSFSWKEQKTKKEVLLSDRPKVIGNI